MGGKGNISENSALATKSVSPTPPPLPGSALTGFYQKGLLKNKACSLRGYSCVSTGTKDLWERLFDEGYRADVSITTDGGGIIFAHSNVLGMASPVMKGLLKKSKKSGQLRSISILGVPHDAVRAFIRYLYSSTYKREEMDEFALQLLVLSHVYMVPHLKKECERQIEHNLLTTENLVDIFQLALLCDSPRLNVISHRMILKNFKSISCTEGWQAMKQSHPILEKELLQSVRYEDNRRKERTRKMNERKMYLQLFDAMEALVHICRDGCRTIGPHDKAFDINQPPCKYEACKGLELLVRHFAGCKLRVPGGCIQCKRMWQLLELHSHLCADSDLCRVPLCRNFKERIRKQSKKDEIKWKTLANKILKTRGVVETTLFLSRINIS